MKYLKTKKIPNQFVVLMDDREKRPWILPYDVKKKRLKTGDYTIKGFEDKIAIEKKSGLAELLTDLANGYRPTFVRFLKRLSKYPIKCIVVEDTLSELSISRALLRIKKKSRGKSRLTARTIYYWTARIAGEYNIPIIFVSKGTKQYILPELFKAVFEKAMAL